MVIWWRILQIVLLNASANKLTVSHEEAEEHAGLVMEVVDIDNRGYLEVRTHFSTQDRT